MFQQSLFSMDNFQSNHVPSTRTDINPYQNAVPFTDNNHMRNIQASNQRHMSHIPRYSYPTPMNNDNNPNVLINAPGSNTTFAPHDYPVNNSQNINDINFIAHRMHFNAFSSDIKPIINLSSISNNVNGNPFRCNDAINYASVPHIEDNHSNSTMSSNSSFNNCEKTLKNDTYTECADIPCWEQSVMDTGINTRHYTPSNNACSAAVYSNGIPNIPPPPHPSNHCIVHGDITTNTTHHNTTTNNDLNFTIPIKIINAVHNNNPSPSTASDSNTLTPNAPSNGNSNTVAVKRKKGDLAPFTNIECAVCGAVCATRDVLIDHSKHYHKKICGYCGKKFARNSNLKEHIRIHTGCTPYVCNMCNRGFKQQHSLKDHIRTHTGEKPFQCEVCGKRFTVKNNLKVHMRVHTGEKPYRCTVCYKRFTQKGSLNTHLRKVHKVKMLKQRNIIR